MSEVLYEKKGKIVYITLAETGCGRNRSACSYCPIVSLYQPTRS